MESTQQMKTTASNDDNRATKSIPSSEALKHAAIKAQNRLAQSLPETTRAAQQMRQPSSTAATFAGSIASTMAEGVKNLMPEHLNTELHTPHPPGAYDSGTDHTHSDEYHSQRDSRSEERRVGKECPV